MSAGPDRCRCFRHRARASLQRPRVICPTRRLGSLPRHVRSITERPPMAARSTQAKMLARSARRAVRKVQQPRWIAAITAGQGARRAPLGPARAHAAYAGPDDLRAIREKLRSQRRPAARRRPDPPGLVDRHPQLRRPALPVARRTDRGASGRLLRRRGQPSYVAVGSVVTRARSGSVGLGLGLLRQRASFTVQVLGPVPRGPRTAHPQPPARRRHRLSTGVRRPGPARPDALLAGGREDPRGRHRHPALRAPVARRRSRTTRSR